jgi:hypothetical protein
MISCNQKQGTLSFSIKDALLLEVSNITHSLCIAKMHTTVYESRIQTKEHIKDKRQNANYKA